MLHMSQTEKFNYKENDPPWVSMTLINKGIKFLYSRKLRVIKFYSTGRWTHVRILFRNEEIFGTISNHEQHVVWTSTINHLLPRRNKLACLSLFDLV
jgi:hypothetical protein